MSDAQSIFEAAAPAQAGPSRTKMSCQLLRKSAPVWSLAASTASLVELETRQSHVQTQPEHVLVGLLIEASGHPQKKHKEETSHSDAG